MSWVSVSIGVGSIGGALIGKQKAPKAATFTPVDAQEEQRKAVDGNLANQDSIEQLLARGNSFTQDQAIGLMEKAMPGYSKIAAKFMDTADGMLTNPYQLPDSVAENLTRLAAERGISTGVRGEAADYNLLRDFGVNELEYGSSRINSAQGILQTLGSLAPRVNPMSPMSLYVTPNTAIQTQSQNNNGEFSAQQAQNNADAAAKNANASMWGGLVSTAGGIAAGAFANKAAALKKGGIAPKHVDTDWSF